MSKAHRGKGIRDQVSHGRGECPVCKRNNVKILYEQEAGEQKFKICKTCKAAIKNGKKKLPVVDMPKPEPVAAAEESPAAASPAEETSATVAGTPDSTAETPTANGETATAE